ncbi:MAG: GNAT family N-acetyltransferase [Acidobacteria bacterium]|nr:GNAT family N-acetyltransferase [Acidobacteriota bacterium]
MDVRLQTSRLRLMPFQRSDVDDLHRMWTEPEVRKYLWDDLVIPRDTVVAIVENSLQSFAESGLGFWMLNLKGSFRIAGFAGLRHFRLPESNYQEVEVLYGLLPDYWGKGLATEAAEAILQYGFQQLRLERIYAGADPPNIASIKVMERLGMKFLCTVNLNGLPAIYYVMRKSQFQADSGAIHGQDSQFS